MIKIQSQPDFWTDVEFVGPGGNVVGTARMKWRAVTRSQFNEMLALPIDDMVKRVLLSWEGIDDEFTGENVQRLLDFIPSAARSMADSFSRGLFAAERKN